MTEINPMAGKRVLVTGAGTGIGRGVALEMARCGARVVLHYCHSGDGAQAAVDEITRNGGSATAIAADFRRFESLAELADAAVEFLGGCDVLVNNAGITYNVPLRKLQRDQFETLMNVNLRSQLFLTQALVPALAVAAPSYVVNLTSIHAFAGQVEHAVYAATKAAIVAATRTLALELIADGIRVNAIAPGWVRVENQDEALGAGFDWKNAPRALPAGRCGDPNDIAQIVVFLASEQSRYILGQTLVADGGQLAMLPLVGDFRQPVPFRFGEKYV